MSALAFVAAGEPIKATRLSSGRECNNLGFTAKTSPLLSLKQQFPNTYVLKQDICPGFSVLVKFQLPDREAYAHCSTRERRFVLFSSQKR